MHGIGAGVERGPDLRRGPRLVPGQRDLPDEVIRERGADLAREMKWLGSYRYGVFNLGGETLEGMFTRFQRVCADITFHPASHRVPDLRLLVTGQD